MVAGLVERSTPAGACQAPHLEAVAAAARRIPPHMPVPVASGGTGKSESRGSELGETHGRRDCHIDLGWDRARMPLLHLGGGQLPDYRGGRENGNLAIRDARLRRPFP